MNDFSSLNEIAKFLSTVMEGREIGHWPSVDLGRAWVQDRESSVGKAVRAQRVAHRSGTSPRIGMGDEEDPHRKARNARAQGWPACGRAQSGQIGDRGCRVSLAGIDRFDRQPRRVRSSMHRYWIPNLVTVVGMLLGFAATVAAQHGDYVGSGWLVIWAAMLDRVDGIVARAFRATSEFGVQMDSFADALNFGVAPASLVYASIRAIPELGMASGWRHVVLLLVCGLWIVASVYRLAKFNVRRQHHPDGEERVFYGVASTLAAGVLAIGYLVLHKYSDPNASFGSPEAFWGPKLWGDWTIPIETWFVLLPAMLVGAWLMASDLPTSKLIPTHTRAFNLFLVMMIGLGVVCGVMRVFPELMAPMPVIWLGLSIVWGPSMVTPGVRPAPFLPTCVGGD